MQLEARDRVPELTGLLSVVSLALVFGAAMDVIPAAALPHAPDWVFAAIPHVNAVVSLAAIGTIAAGWRAIRRDDVTRHRAFMATSLALFVVFLVLYLYRVSVEGPTSFPGPEVMGQYVYLPLLAVHVTLAVVCIPLLYYVVLLALTRPVAELRETIHPRVGRVAASLWLVSFTLGTAVYLMLYVIW